MFLVLNLLLLLHVLLCVGLIVVTISSKPLKLKRGACELSAVERQDLGTSILDVGPGDPDEPSI